MVFGSDMLTVKVTGWDWPSAAPVDDRVELLRERTEWLHARIRELRDDTHRIIDAQHAELTAEIAGHPADLSAMRCELERRERAAAAIDAAGLPVIGVA